MEECAKDADNLVLMVVSIDQAEEILFGRNGVAKRPPSYAVHHLLHLQPSEEISVLITARCLHFYSPCT
jgi:3-hydroxyisobutyrate dehydrogenase-like beta-hydroxyacid dehydrogenase